MHSMFNSQQKSLWKKEAHCISVIADWAAENHHKFIDCHGDYSTGIDVVIDRVGYDLKVTDKNLIDIQKDIYNDRQFRFSESPLEMHLDVDYLIARATSETSYDLYLLRKFDLWRLWHQHPQTESPELYHYIDHSESIDGNSHLTIDFSCLLSERPLYRVSTHSQQVNHLFNIG